MPARRARLTLTLVLFGLSAACGPSTYELWQRESVYVLEQCGQTSGELAEVLRECRQRQHAVNRKYGQPPDAFYEATIAYWIAVAERVNRGELTQAEGEALSAQFFAYMTLQRQQLEALKSSQRALDAAAYQAYLSNVWQNWNLQLPPQPRPQLRTPIRCRTYSVSSSVYTDCN